MPTTIACGMTYSIEQRIRIVSAGSFFCGLPFHRSGFWTDLNVVVDQMLQAKQAAFDDQVLIAASSNVAAWMLEVVVFCILAAMAMARTLPLALFEFE